MVTNHLSTEEQTDAMTNFNPQIDNVPKMKRR